MYLGVFLLVFILSGGARSRCRNGDLQESSHQQVSPGAAPAWATESLRSGRSVLPRRLWSRGSTLGPSARGTSCAPSQSGVSVSCSPVGLLPPVTDPGGWGACRGARNPHSCGRASVMSLFSRYELPASRYGIWLCCESAPPHLTVTSFFVCGYRKSLGVNSNLICQWWFSSQLWVWCFHERWWPKVLQGYYLNSLLSWTRHHFCF